VRIALGATAPNVLWMVTRRAMTLVGAGLLIGGVGALGVTRILRTLLYEVSATDPAAFAAVVASIFAIGALASAIPAWRALHVDPALTLRSE
jgi:putative ABC transport system permease protein